MKRALLVLVWAALLGAIFFGIGFFGGAVTDRLRAPPAPATLEATATFALALPTVTLVPPTETPQPADTPPPTQTPWVIEVTTVFTQVVVVTPAASPTATPTPICLTPSPAIPWSFLPGGVWDSATLEVWTRANLETLKYLLGVMGIEDPEELEFIGVRAGVLPEDTPMFAVREDGSIFQGWMLPAGTRVWYLVFQRPDGEEVTIPVNPACVNLVGIVLTPGATAIFTPLPSPTPGGPTPTPTSTPWGPTATPTWTPVGPTNTPGPTDTPGPTATPPPEPTPQPPTSVPTATAQPVATPTPPPTDAPPTPTPVPATSTPVSTVMPTPSPNPTATPP